MEEGKVMTITMIAILIALDLIALAVCVRRRIK